KTYPGIVRITVFYRVLSEVGRSVFCQRNVLRKLEELDVFGGYYVPKIFSTARFASDSFNQAGTAEAEGFDLDEGILSFKRSHDSPEDRAAGEGTLPDDLPFFLCTLNLCGGLLGKKQRSWRKQIDESRYEYELLESLHKPPAIQLTLGLDSRS